jgi:hypothetical protein
MTRTARILIIGAATALGAACAERISSSALGPSQLDAAFTSTPLGFESASSSFGGPSSTTGVAFMPGADDGHRGHGRNGLPDGFDFMGGGLSLDFMGGPLGGGRPFDGDRDDALTSSCTFSATTGLVSCTETRNGLTITRTEAFKDATGAAQSAPTATTDTVVIHSEIAGTITRRNGSVTTVNHVSDRTVGGLATTSTQRSVSGKSKGTETTTGMDSIGTFTVSRVIGDTVTGIIVPIANGRPTYPTAGSVVRAMQATLTYTGKSPVSSSRREVITYDGSAAATLVITQDGTTKTCTLPLPHGHPVCQ